MKMAGRAAGDSEAAREWKRRHAVAAGASINHSWACSVEDDQNADRNCTLVLQDALFRIIDVKLVLFHTNATQYDTHPTLQGGASVTGPGSLNSGDGSCAALCPQLMNFWCAVIHWCWLRLFEGLLVWAFLLGFAYWVVKGGPCRLASQLSSSSEEEERRRPRRRRPRPMWHSDVRRSTDVASDVPAPHELEPPEMSMEKDTVPRLQQLIDEIEMELEQRQRKRRRGPPTAPLAR
jgi:hypothetical protein